MCISKTNSCERSVGQSYLHCKVEKWAQKCQMIFYNHKAAAKEISSTVSRQYRAPRKKTRHGFLDMLLFSHSVVSYSLQSPGLQHPGLPLPHYLVEFAQVHVHCISDAIQPSHPLAPSSPSAVNLSLHQGLFQ